MALPPEDRVGDLERRNAALADALERLRASEERWRTIVSTDPECVKTVSPDGYLIEMNPAGLAMLSADSLEQAQSRPLLDWIAPEHRPAFAALHQRVMAGETAALEFEVIGATGERRWLRTTAAPLRDSHGAITCVLGISRDITGERELEAQLRHSQKMDAIGQLAGGIAHDFNNILMVIQGFAMLLLDESMDAEERRTATAHIVEASERAAGLTKQLLAFGRRHVVRAQDVDINEVVTDLSRMVRRVLGEDINLQVELSPRPAWVHADRGLLDQVLMNLVLNARDAMPAGGLLRIDTSVRASGGVSQVVVRVTDTGTGIDPAIVSRIFDPFFTTKEPGKGSGLGLATAFGIVAQHGGRIDVTTTVRLGSTFEVVLPARGGEARAPAPVVASQVKAGSETILLVEDERAVLEMTRTVLERAGYRVVHASNGVEALRAWETHGAGVDLVMSDIVMPEGISGVDLAARLQAKRPGLRILFTSGYSKDFGGRELSLKDRQWFLQKPAAPQEILAAVRRALEA